MAQTYGVVQPFYAYTPQWTYVLPWTESDTVSIGVTDPRPHSVYVGSGSTACVLWMTAARDGASPQYTCTFTDSGDILESSTANAFKDPATAAVVPAVVLINKGTLAQSVTVGNIYTVATPDGDFSQVVCAGMSGTGAQNGTGVIVIPLRKVTFANLPNGTTLALKGMWGLEATANNASGVVFLYE